MMVGVPVLLVVCDSAPVPPVWVMAVGVGVFWWCVFQCWVAVVWASSVVPGVLECLGVVVVVGVVVFWLVSCGGGLVVWLCVSGVVVVVVVGVVVFWWFRMLTCSGLFLFSWFCLLFVLSCLVNNGLSWVWCVGLRVCGCVLVVCCVWFCFCLWGAAAGVGAGVCGWGARVGVCVWGCWWWRGCASLCSSALVVVSSSGFVSLSGSVVGSVSSASLRSASAGGGVWCWCLWLGRSGGCWWRGGVWWWRLWLGRSGGGCGACARFGFWCWRVGVGVGWPGWCGGVGECARVGGVSGFRVPGVCACARVRLPRVSCCFVWV